MHNVRVRGLRMPRMLDSFIATSYSSVSVLSFDRLHDNVYLHVISWKKLDEMDVADKRKFICPVFFYEHGKSNIDFTKKIKVEVEISTSLNLEDAKREIRYECLLFSDISYPFFVAYFC